MLVSKHTFCLHYCKLQNVLKVVRETLSNLVYIAAEVSVNLQKQEKRQPTLKETVFYAIAQVFSQILIDKLSSH